MPEQTSFPKTSVELIRYELEELQTHFTDLTDFQDSLGVDVGRALERINCLESLDSLAFIRADITYIRQQIASANSTRFHIANVLRDIKEVFGGLKDAEDEV